ncbi:MAG: class I SAM-dependent rRNA methyltransferase [Alphaproteobacteria bacterium]|nr:class I SAM-dependent rRNA methyltransferase [Alphaproteobacteria bacterium]
MDRSSSDRPVVRLLPRQHRRVRDGHPWVYSNEIEMSVEARAIEPGRLVIVQNAGGEPVGTATFNPHSLVVARLLGHGAILDVDAAFLAGRLRRALALRERLFGEPYYRLVHAEADGLPGLIVDRFGDVVTCQTNTAGMERLLPDLLDALDRVLAPRAIVLRNDSSVRALERLDSYVRIAKGELSGPVEIRENGVRLFADPIGGQKTGWFYDQRDNRACVAGLCRGASVLDLYAYAGGFAVQAAVAGAAKAVALDRSEAALALAAEAARLNGVEARVETRRANAFEELERLGQAGERFDMVVADPPAFVKSRKDLQPGLRGYRKLARLAAAVVAPGGFLFAASCSHNVPVEAFAEQVRHGLTDAGRGGRILRGAGAAPDHPVHPFLPESAYLKSQLLQLD